jgi:hypothetical protein
MIIAGVVAAAGLLLTFLTPPFPQNAAPEPRIRSG